METNRFQDGQLLASYLVAQPIEVTQLIILRCSLRLMCSLEFAIKSSKWSIAQKSSLILQVFRANFISWVAAAYPDFNLKLAAARAAVAAQSADGAFSARASAAYAAEAFADRETALERAVSLVATFQEPSYSLWAAVENDLALYRNDEGAVLIRQPLWVGDSAPVSLAKQSRDFQKSLSQIGSDWMVIGDWYRAIEAGELPFAHLISGESLTIKHIASTVSFWEREPRVVMRDISERLGNSFRDILPNDSNDGGAGTEPKTNIDTKNRSRKFDLTSTLSNFRGDGPARDEDHLNRAHIAFALAGRLNLIWDELNLPSAVGKKSADVFDSILWTGLRPRRWHDDLLPGFVVHVDAPWGGGKTSFARYLEQILNPYRNAGPLPEWLRPLLTENNWPERHRRPWHIVNFNAWRHQHVSPPWWVFFDAIRVQCSTAARAETNQRDDQLPPPAPLNGYFDWCARHSEAVARWLRQWVWGTVTPEIKLGGIATIAVLAMTLLFYHWGLLAIGDGGLQLNGGPVFLTAIVTLGGVAALKSLIQAFATSLFLGSPAAAKSYALGAGDPLDRFRTHFAWMIASFRRPVLVVIDDLDRCEPAYVAGLLSGMQTILTSQRVIYLLLGDRDWIERSFSETYKSMRASEKEDEHTFGGRFVEKSIQMSFVLPEVQDPEKTAYVRQVLDLEDPAKTVSGPPVLAKDNEAGMTQAALDRISAIPEFEAREQAGADLLAKMEDSDAAQETIAAQTKALRETLSLRAAFDETVARATSHMLEPLVPLLPANPRQIKRIINTITFIEEIARLSRGTAPGSTEWQIVARWGILALDWPRAWYTLSTHPVIADHLIGRATGELDYQREKDLLKALQKREDVLRLLCFEDETEGWPKADIGSEQIEWLRQLMPPTSGQEVECT